MATRRGPDNSARVVIAGNFALAVTNWANVFHVQFTTSSSISQSDLDSWLTTFQTNYKTRFAPRATSSVNYATATATLYSPGGGVLQSQVSMTGNGTSGGTSVADISAAKCVSWLSTVYWRGGKPRTYLPGVATTEVSNNNVVTGGEITALQTAANAFRSDTNAQAVGTITGTTFGFVSFNSGNAPRANPLFFAITGSKAHPRLASQRRRLGKWHP